MRSSGFARNPDFELYRHGLVFEHISPYANDGCEAMSNQSRREKWLKITLLERIDESHETGK